MRRLIEVVKSESRVFCDYCKNPIETPLEQAESVHIDKYDFHKNCILKLIKNYEETTSSKLSN